MKVVSIFSSNSLQESVIPPKSQTFPLMATFISFTFIQPITEPIEDDTLLASGHQTNGTALHRRAIVDVVLENEDL